MVSARLRQGNHRLTGARFAHFGRICFPFRPQRPIQASSMVDPSPELAAGLDGQL